MGRRFRVQSSIIGLLIGIGCLAILLRQVDLKQSWAALGRLNGPYMAVPLLIFFVNLPMRAWRWQLIFPAATRPSFHSCLMVLGIGNMANFLLPGRAGDLARCALVGPSGSLDESSHTLGTLAIEKVLDGLALVAMVLFSAWALHPPRWLLELLRLSALIFGVAVVSMVALRYRTRAIVEVVRRITRQMRLSSLEGKFEGLLISFSNGLSAITSTQRVLVLLGLTGLIWASEAAVIWGLAHALNVGVSFTSAVIASSVLGLGLMIPAAPGGLGTYELFGTEAFKLVGIAAGSGLAVTIVIHAWVFVANIAVGVVMLGLQGLSLTQLRNRVDNGPTRITST